MGSKRLTLQPASQTSQGAGARTPGRPGSATARGLMASLTRTWDKSSKPPKQNGRTGRVQPEAFPSCGDVLPLRNLFPQLLEEKTLALCASQGHSNNQMRCDVKAF